jgi:hypothetical protein
MDGAGEVRLENISGTAGVPSLNRWFRGTLHQDVELADVDEIGGIANIAMDEVNSPVLQTRQRQLAAASFQVIQRTNVCVWQMAFEKKGQIGSDESSPSSDENPHAVRVNTAPR